MPLYIAIEYFSTEMTQMNDFGTVERTKEDAWDAVKTNFDPALTVIHEIPTTGWKPFHTKTKFKYVSS